MDSLVNIAVFGIVGAAMMAALVGLLLVVSSRGSRATPLLFGTVSVVLLIGVPSLAALDLLSGDPAAGVGRAFLAAFCVVAVIYAANVSLLPLVARRAAAARGGPLSAELRLSPAILVGGLLICALLGLVGAGLATVVS